MKMKQAIKTLVAAVALATAGGAMAAPVVSLVGDKDGLGLGLSSGDGFNFFDVGPADGDGTDELLDGGMIASHISNWSGTLIGASLEIFSGGWGLDGQAGVYFGTHFLGLLSNGDDTGPNGNQAFLDTFDLTPYLLELTGNDSFEIRTAAGDAGALDYSQLTLQVRDAIGDPGTVPEPATLALVSLALAGVSWQRRRR